MARDGSGVRAKDIEHACKWCELEQMGTNAVAVIGTGALGLTWAVVKVKLEE